MDPFEFLEKIAPLLDNRVPEYPRVWENYCKTIPEPEFGYSEMSAIGALIKHCRNHVHCIWQIVLLSAMLSYTRFLLRLRYAVIGGTSGIEGSLSTAVGYAAGSG